MSIHVGLTAAQDLADTLGFGWARGGGGASGIRCFEGSTWVYARGVSDLPLNHL
jgi:hypothetical protein